MRFVPAASLIPGMMMARDILCNNSNAAMLKKGVLLTEKAIEYIQGAGYMGAYISDTLSADVELEEAVSQQVIMKGLDAVASGNVGSIIGVATDIVADITSKKDVSVDLFDLRSYDDYTFHHSVNVGVFAVAVGSKMGLLEAELKNLSIAGICHDLGKIKIPDEIINKNGKLTDEEFAEIKSHPKYSFDILQENRMVPSIVRQAVLYHHENENGTGYPYGKEGDEIPIFAKIIHAVDVYDALTSRRAYKEPFAPADAFEYMNNGIDNLFDREVVNAMNEVIPAYPPGIDVILSNGEEALVIGHTTNALRPRIRLLKTGANINLMDEQYAELKIVKSGIMPSDYVGEIDLLNEDRGTKKKKTKELIMILDDDFLIGKMTEDLLKENYRTVYLDSGLSAIKYFSEGNEVPDLIISDVEMPIMSGILTIKNLRNKTNLKTPVIFMTSSSDRNTVIKCREVGAIDFILKPANPMYLRQRVELALHYNRDI